ncbi:MAG: siderophore-interacting protein [Pseudomonadota bacterium]
MLPRTRSVTVESFEDLSPHMRRFVLTGPDLADFPPAMESAHVKVMVPSPADAKPSLLSKLAIRKQMRSYTIRFFDRVSKRLTIDFAINDHRGRAADWAKEAKVGDELTIAGPGSVKHPDFNAPWHLFAADLTALPALAATLERLPRDAQGHVVVQIPDEADKQELALPTAMTLEWLIAPTHIANGLLDRVKALPWLRGEPAMFVACESAEVVAIRNYLRTQPMFNAKKLYASGYWTAE